MTLLGHDHPLLFTYPRNQAAAARTWSKVGLRKVWRSTAPVISWAEPPAVMNLTSVTPINASIEQGVIAGRLDELRRILRRVISMRFAEIGNLPELDAIQDPEQLELLLDRLITDENLDQARRAIRELIPA